MKATPLAIPDVILLEPKVFGDDRGYFFKSLNQAKFEAAIGRQVTFVQDNHSRSVKNVLRGLHHQIQQPQGKLVRVVQGEVFDVAVDIRKSSPTFGQWVGEILSERTNAKCGCLKVSRMASSCCQTPLSASTKPPTTTRRSTNAALSGTIQLLFFSGPSTASRTA